LRRQLGRNKEESEQIEAEVPSLASAKELVTYELQTRRVS